MSMKHDRDAITGALDEGFAVTRIGKALNLRPNALKSVLAGRGRLNSSQKHELETLTGKSIAELAFNAMLKASDPKTRREDRDLIRITRQMLRELRPVTSNGHSKSARKVPRSRTNGHA